MKKVAVLVMLILTGFILNGCYTVLWSPDMDYSTKRLGFEEKEEYYPETYYGDYYFFYDTPWWYYLPSQDQTNEAKTRSENKDIKSLRDDISRDRPTNTRIDVAAPSRDGNPSNSGNTTPSTSTNTQQTKKVDSDTNSSSNNSNSSRSSNNTNDNNSRDLRNSDNNRSTDKPRR